MKKIALGLLIAAFGGSFAFAQTPSITYAIDSGGFELKDSHNTLLSAGNLATAGDGFAIQLGYYSEATATNLFAGTWTPFAGAGTANYSTFSIGDFEANGAGPGSFAFSMDFTNLSPSIPTSARFLTLQFYDATTVASATYFGAVSSTAWTWSAPANPPPVPVNMSLAESGLVWLDNNAFMTGTASAVPEPSTYAAVLGAMVLGVVGYRRFRRR